MTKITNITDSFFQSRIASHAAFWLVTLILLAYHSSLFGTDFKVNLVELSVMLPMQMIAAYVLIYVQIPYLLYQKRWFTFTISLQVLAYILAVLARLAIINIAEPLTQHDGYNESLGEVLSDPLYLLKVYIPSVYTPAVLFLTIKMLKDRFQQENRLISLEKEKSIAELNFLKAQMNPHFLFNTLNNIYALAKNKSDETPEMILRLSDILDYTIYECNEATVPIYKEWQLIENYVDLQAVRHSDKLMISIDQDIDDEAMPVAPLILISFVENAFKHSLRHLQDLANIKIFLKLKAGILTFSVFNTCSAIIKKKGRNKKGIGVKNVKQQLALQYPNQHQLQIIPQPDSYQVTLTIQLKK